MTETNAPNVLPSAASRRREKLAPAQIVLIYALFAGLWIVASGLVTVSLFESPELRTYVEHAKGLAFVAVTSGVLYLVLRGLIDPKIAIAPRLDYAWRSRWFGLALIGVVIVFALPMLSGLAIYRYHAEQMRLDVFAELSSVAKLKAEQIERWLAERYGDGFVLDANTTFAEQAGRLAAGKGDAVTRDQVMARLNVIRSAYGYKTAMVLDADARLLSATGADPELSDDLSVLVRRSAANETLLRRDLSREENGDIHMDWIVPLFVNQRTFSGAIVVLRMSAHDFLYPMIQTWPRQSRTAEIILARRDGDHGLYLNTLRNRPDAPLTLRRDLSDPKDPRNIVLGSSEPGEIEGPDYRGQLVLLAYRPVAGTTWHLAAKIDRDEAFADLYELGALTATTVFFSVLAILIMVLLLWRQYRVGLELEAELQKQNADRLLKMFVDLPFVGIGVIARNSGQLIQFNHHFCTMLGYTPDEMKTKRPQEIIHADDLERAMNQFIRVTSREIDASTIPLRLVRRDETTMDTESSLQPIVQADGEIDYYAMMVEDVTERKKLVDNLADQSRRLKEVLWGTNVGTWEWTIPTGEVIVNERFAEIVGYTSEELAPISIKTWERLVHPDDFRKSNDSLEEVFTRELEFYECEARMRHKDGSWVWISDRGSVVEWGDDGKPVRMSGMRTDITRQKLAEERIVRLSEIRDLVLRCQSLMLTTPDEIEFLKEIANILVDARGYDLVWFGVPQYDAIKSVLPVAKAGRAAAYLDSIEIHWSEDSMSQGPTGMAIKTGRVQLLPDMARSVTFAPWRKAAEEAGFKSSAVFPLIGGGRVSAVLAVFNSYADSFDEDEVQLLSDLAADIGTHLHIRRTEIEKNEVRASLDRASLGAIDAIAATIEKRDPYTSGHQARVAEMSVAIATELGWTDSRIQGLRLGATIHDIGKIYVPAEILNRPGKLSPSEFTIIKSHSQVGYEILEHTDFPWPIKEMILQHHERVDGSGYPNGLKGDQIIDEAKMIVVADVVEAITSHRPYRPGLGLDKALAEIESGRGIGYDPAVVDACLRLFREKNYTLPQ